MGNNGCKGNLKNKVILEKTRVKEREIAPDFIKGICIILMVYGHLNYQGSSASIQKQIVALIYTFHIPVFLIISGIFFNYSLDPKSSTKRITQRLIIPYLLFLSIYLLGLFIVNKLGIHTENKPIHGITDYLITLLYKPYGSYWFLHSLIVMQGLMILTWSICSVFKAYKSLIFFILFAFILIICTHIEIISLRTATYFFLGNIIAVITKKSIHLSKIAGLVFLTSISALIIFKLDIYTFNIFQIIWCLSIFFSLWILAQTFDKLKFTKIISWIGQNTLIILVLHALFMVAIKVTTPLFLKLDQTGILYSITASFIVIAFCILAAKIFDQIKISRYIFGVESIYRKLN